MIHAPLIGLTLDNEPGGPRDFSRWPYYALRQNYFTAVSQAGGLPVGIPHEAGCAEAFVSRIDGLIITGGAFDPDPALYGETRHPLTALKPQRTKAELALLHAAFSRNLPVLGICGGMQLLAIAEGGSLFQHLPDQRQSPIAHEQPNPRDEASHMIDIIPETLLAHCTRQQKMQVNSSHHQGVRDPGKLRVSATAPDGLIEAIESGTGIFRLGVQWHPEFAIDPGDARIMAAFIRAATDAARQDR